MVYAIHHRLGCSLFNASKPETAIRKAEKAFGTHNGPYTLAPDQANEISSAKAMGAVVLDE